MLKTMLIGAAAVSAMAGAAHAASFSFQTNLSTDDEVQLFNFTVGATSTVTLRTFSYAGGVQADGTVVSAGGFDPILSLFDSSGTFIDGNDDGAGVPVDPETGAPFDTEFSATLDPGTYTVAVSQYDNFALGDLGDGFVRDGQTNFTFTDGFCDPAQPDFDDGFFCDVTGDDRTGFLAFDITGVDTAAIVPVPGAVLLFGSMLAGAGVFRRSKA